jgi:hypothetical protein
VVARPGIPELLDAHPAPVPASRRDRVCAAQVFQIPVVVRGVFGSA